MAAHNEQVVGSAHPDSDPYMEYIWFPHQIQKWAPPVVAGDMGPPTPPERNGGVVLQPSSDGRGRPRRPGAGRVATVPER